MNFKKPLIKPKRFKLLLKSLKQKEQIYSNQSNEAIVLSNSIKQLYQTYKTMSKPNSTSKISKLHNQNILHKSPTLRKLVKKIINNKKYSQICSKISKF